MNLSRARMAIALILLLSIVPITRASANEGYEVSSLEVTSGAEIQAGEKLSFDYDATHPEDLEWVTVSFVDGYGQWVSFYDGSPNGSSFEKVISVDHRPGSFVFRQVSFTWTDGHGLTFFSEGRTYEYPPGGYGDHDFDLSVFDFSFVNPDPDLAVPELVSLSLRSNEPLGRNQDVVIDYEIRDRALGDIEFVFSGPSGRSHWMSPNEDFPRGLVRWYETETVGGSWVSGVYQLERVEMRDRTGNLVTLLRNGEASVTPEGIEGPMTHGLDFSQVDFVVDNPNADEYPPTLNSISRFPESEYLLPGEVLEVTYDATDPAGVNYAWLAWVYDDRSFYHYDFGVNGLIEGVKTIGITEEMVGTHKFLLFGAYDTNWNHAAYYWDGTLSAFGSSGRHEFDLSVLDFEVRDWPFTFQDGITEGQSISIDPASGKFRFAAGDSTLPVLQAEATELAEDLISLRYDDGDISLQGTFDLASGRFEAVLRNGTDVYTMANSALGGVGL